MPEHVKFTVNGGLKLDILDVASLPQVLVGPILRRLERGTIALFLVLKSAETVSVNIWKDSEPTLSKETSVTSEAGIRIGRHLYAYVINCAAPAGGFVSRQRYSYSLSIGGISWDLSALKLANHNDPGFWGLPDNPEDFSILHSSCRRPHGNFRDGLARAIEEIEASNPPQLLLLSGDQVYCDDTATLMMALIQQIGAQLVVIEEKNANGKSIFNKGIKEIGHRQALTNIYGLSGDMAANHLWTLEEFYAHYLLAWSDVLWPEVFPESWDEVADDVMHDVPMIEILQKSWEELRKDHPHLKGLSPELADELWMELELQWGQTSIVRRFAAKQRKHDDAPRLNLEGDKILGRNDVRPWPWDDLLVSVDTSKGVRMVILGDDIRDGAEITIQNTGTNSLVVARESGYINNNQNQQSVELKAKSGDWMTFAVNGKNAFAFRHQGNFRSEERRIVTKSISLRRDQLNIWGGLTRLHLLVDASSGTVTLTVYPDLPVDVTITVEKVDTSANIVTITPSEGVGGFTPVSLTNYHDHRTVRLKRLPNESEDGNTHYSADKDAGDGLPSAVAKNEERDKAYQTAWSDELDRVKEYKRTLPIIRKILANVPSLMIFDDHEVTDDWNLNFPWYLSAYGRNMFTGDRNPGGQVVCNGLMAYLVFQHWGNVPGRVATHGSVEQVTLDALSWSGAHPGYDTMRPYLGLPVYGMTYKGNGLYEEWQSLVGTNHYQPEGFCLRVPSSDAGIRWDYRLGPNEGYPVHVVVLDERTWRSCPNDDGPAARISKSALDLMWPIPTGDQADTPTLLIAPAPVLGLHVIEHVIQPLFGIMLQSGAATYDWESWSADTRGFEALLERIAQWKQVVILSGDVHFGYTKTLDYEKGQTKGRAIQFVASSSKYSDPKTLLLQLLGEFLAKLGVVRTRKFVGWESRPAGGPFDKLLMLPHEATGKGSITLPWDEIIDVALGRMTRRGLGGSVFTQTPEPLVLSDELANAYGLTGHTWAYTISHVDDRRLLDPNGKHKDKLVNASSQLLWDSDNSLKIVKALRANDLMRIGRVLTGMPMVARIDFMRPAGQPLHIHQTLLLSPGVRPPQDLALQPKVVTYASLEVT